MRRGSRQSSANVDARTVLAAVKEASGGATAPSLTSAVRRALRTYMAGTEE